MRGEYDLCQPKDDTEGEHFQFKCHWSPEADCETDSTASRGTSGIFRQRTSGRVRFRHRPEEVRFVSDSAVAMHHRRWPLFLCYPKDCTHAEEQSCSDSMAASCR